MLKFEKIEIFLKLQKKTHFHPTSIKINTDFPKIPTMETFCIC